MDLTDRQQLIVYLQSHGLYTKKKLGQNFLVDRDALNKIVAAAELSKDDCIIEVGAGLGTLTEELILLAGKVIAVELDQKLAEILSERLSIVATPSSLSVIPAEAGISYSDGSPGHGLRLPEDDKRGGGKIEIINADILKLNLSELTKDCQSYKVVANIPYYITSKILRFFLEAEKKLERIVLLTQKEVAERICAKPGAMSILSVSVQYYGSPEIIGIVPKTSFFPMPEVDSAILRIAVTSNGYGNDARIGKGLRLTLPKNETGFVTDQRTTKDESFFRCVHVGFASRRKTLLNNLSAGYQMDKKPVLDILKSVGLNDRTRAQELSVEEWSKLCTALDSK